MALEESFAAQERPTKTSDDATFFRADQALHARLAALAGMPNVWKSGHSVKDLVDGQRYTLMSGIPFRSLRAYREHKISLTASWPAMATGRRTQCGAM